VAARYLPAGAEEIGGDWFDVIALPEDRVAITMGDVAGHGIEAGALMAGLRHSVRAYALDGHPPAAIAERVDRLFPGEFATFIFLVYDPATCMIRYANAGHLPPLLITPDGTTSFLDQARSVPLGLEHGVPFTEEELHVPHCGTILVYTDGLMERRGEGIASRLAECRRVEVGAPTDPEALCNHVLRELPPDGSDDVAILAFQALGIARHVFRVPMDPSALAGMRARVEAWLHGIGVSEESAEALVFVCNEACTNAIEHSGASEDLELELRRLDGRVEVAVRDVGAWDPTASDPDFGRGLDLIDLMTDRLQVVRSPEGTIVTMARTIDGPAPDEHTSEGRVPLAGVSA
jgi:anti-sigma regulatory factor (Ser/Thr protein kinase)